MIIASAIITAPRPVPTLHDSIRSWRNDGGFTGPLFVLADNVPGITGTMLIVRDNVPVLGNLRNWARALATLYSETNERWLMVMEDDITWATGACEALKSDIAALEITSTFRRRCGAISLYLPRRHTAKVVGRLPPGYHSTGLQRGRGTWGAQCLLFSRAQALELMQDHQWAVRIGDATRDRNVDAVIAQCINDRGKEIFYRVPCLVNHDLGRGNSSLGYKPDRPNLDTDYFTGQA